jgi:ATP-binding cassette subfamily B protein
MLNPGENVLASLTVDLTEDQRFGSGELRLTERRLLAGQDAADWTAYPLQPGCSCATGTTPASARWSCSRPRPGWPVALHPGGQRAGHPLRPPLRAGDGGAGDRPGRPVRTRPAARHHAPLPPDSDECPICTRELNTPPSTWVLLRLWRFARPYQGSCWPASC